MVICILVSRVADLYSRICACIQSIGSGFTSNRFFFLYLEFFPRLVSYADRTRAPIVSNVSRFAVWKMETPFDRYTGTVPMFDRYTGTVPMFDRYTVTRPMLLILLQHFVRN